MKPHIIKLTDEERAMTIHPAKEEDVAHVLGQGVNDDGRSEWVWVRLPNGDLVLGVFPRGDTYFSMEKAAEYPRAKEEIEAIADAEEVEV